MRTRPVLAAVVAVALFATIGTATASALGSTQESTSTAPVASETTSTPATTETALPALSQPAKPAVTYRAMPKIKRGMKRATLAKVLKNRQFRAKYRYTFGKRNAVRSWKLPNYWKHYPRRKYDKKHKRFLYVKHTQLIVTLGNGKKPKPWHTGTATWYSIADNTPAGSRQTSSGHPLGSFKGFTFASRNFPMGTKLRIKHGGRTRTVTCTDRGGLQTIDLYKPASNYFHMDGMSRFKYQVIRRGW